MKKPLYSGRRSFLQQAALLALLPATPVALAAAHTEASPLAALESGSGGRLGVFGWNMANDAMIEHRSNECFPLCSTFKLVLAGAILARSAIVQELLEQRLLIAESQLVAYSPITSKHAGGSLAIGELCKAALQYSDNSAANLLMDFLGGPAAVTAYARSIGDDQFRIDRMETGLNQATPGDLRDTSTPAAMGRTLQALILGDVLPSPQRGLLKEWMLGNTTGANRIRAAVPARWAVADKTGSGNYGTTNDIAVLWPEAGGPVCLAVYYTQQEKNAKWRDDVIRSATVIALEALI